MLPDFHQAVNRAVNRTIHGLSTDCLPTAHSCPSLSATINHNPSLSITAQHRPSLSIAIRHCQSLPISANHCPSLSITINHNPPQSIHHCTFLPTELHRTATGCPPGKMPTALSKELPISLTSECPPAGFQPTAHRLSARLSTNMSTGLSTG